MHGASVPVGRTEAGAGPALLVEGLEKVYDDGTVALHGLDLHVPAGAFYGLLGRTVPARQR